MKKLLYIIGISLLLIVSSTSCSEDTTGDVSRITNYANLVLNGKDVVIVKLGDTYTEEGIIATEDGKTIPYETESNVDINNLGVYHVVYTAENSDGYSKSVARTVIVKLQSPPTDDFTGNYQRNAGAKGISNWTKIEDGVFFVTDIGGANIPSATVYVVSIATNQFSVFNQFLGGEIGNEVSCDNGADDPIINFVPGSPSIYKWRVLNSGYGPAVRTFEKR